MNFLKAIRILDNKGRISLINIGLYVSLPNYLMAVNQMNLVLVSLFALGSLYLAVYEPQAPEAPQVPVEAENGSEAQYELLKAKFESDIAKHKAELERDLEILNAKISKANLALGIKTKQVGT